MCKTDGGEMHVKVNNFAKTENVSKEQGTLNCLQYSIPSPLALLDIESTEKNQDQMLSNSNQTLFVSVCASNEVCG